MANQVLSNEQFHDEVAAYAWVEARLWANGRPCPHCGTVDQSSKMQGKSTRIGLYKCYACRKPFTVKIGTIFESSHIPLRLWLQAIFLICSSKKGISANQLHRTLGITLKSAWFMAHRIREAMREGGFAPFGNDGGAVEVDETFIGTEPGKVKKRAFHHKMKVLTLVDRNSGLARSMVIDDLKPSTIAPLVRENMAKEAHLMTDEAGSYLHLGKEFAAHSVVRHGRGEYVVGDAHTNTIESYFSIFKRGMRGIYQQCSKKHLHRYLAEFDFRYNHRVANGINDEQRAVEALKGAVGKRLTYRAAGQP